MEVDPEELADILEEQKELEEEAFRAARWPEYVKYVDSLVRLPSCLACVPIGIPPGAGKSRVRLKNKSITSSSSIGKAIIIS